MTICERYAGVFAWFETNRPVVQTELSYRTPYELLVAVILSAQCTDKRVNMVTPALFEQFPDPFVLAEASSDLVFEYIRSISYPNNKAKHLVGMAKALVAQYDGIVPDSIEELMKLPGVGRKTANVVASVIYDVPAIAVDTHVYRVSRRIGLAPSSANTPLKVEQTLMRHLPAQKYGRAHHWLILHGRYVCTARTPHCHECPLQAWCRYFEKRQRASCRP